MTYIPRSALVGCRHTNAGSLLKKKKKLKMWGVAWRRGTKNRSKNRAKKKKKKYQNSQTAEKNNNN